MKASFYIKITVMMIVMFFSINCRGQEVSKNANKQAVQFLAKNLNAMATEGVSIVFIFEDYKPTFADMLLILGIENEHLPAEQRTFEKLKNLNLNLIDDSYFGLENEPGNINNVLGFLLVPIRETAKESDTLGYASIAMDYVPLRCEANRAELVKLICVAFKKQLNVKVFFEQQEVTDNQSIIEKIDEIMAYCIDELNREPGSEEVIALLDNY